MLTIEYMSTGFVIWEDNKKLATFDEIDAALAYIKNIVLEDIRAHEIKLIAREAPVEAYL